MKEETHIDAQITQMLHDLGVQAFDSKNIALANKLVDYIKNGVLALNQTQSSRHDWSITVEDIKGFFN